MSGWKGIDSALLEAAGIVFDGELVRIPYRRSDGTVWTWRIFRRDGRCWWLSTGLGLIPFGLETLPPAEQATEIALLIAEGESDALALREAFAERKGPGRIAGYAVLGLPGAGSWRSDWRPFVDPHAVIYIVGDGDAAGRGMVERLYREIPWSRSVWLPEGEDARSLLQREGPLALDPYLDAADAAARFVVAFMRAESYEDFLELLSGEPKTRAREIDHAA
jgi:hypothetical protein